MFCVTIDIYGVTVLNKNKLPTNLKKLIHSWCYLCLFFFSFFIGTTCEGL